MNCQEFEANFRDLGRGAMTDARARDEALSHERACGRCRALLADERALSTGLRALAASTENASAPPRVEAALLAAFRARAAEVREGVAAAPAAVSNVVPLLAARERREAARVWTWRKTLATAAAAAAAALALFAIIPPGASVPPTAAPGQASKMNGVAPPPPATVVDGRLGGEEARPSEVVSGAHAVRNSTPAREMRTARTAPRPAAMNASYGPRPAAREEEITTDFIPLMQGAQGAGLDSGAVVRVELPRSALASLGLPVNAERAHERVKADVVVGEDGTARAIRFVR